MKKENIPTGAAKSSAGGGRGLRPGLSGTAAMRKKKKGQTSKNRFMLLQFN